MNSKIWLGNFWSLFKAINSCQCLPLSTNKLHNWLSIITKAHSSYMQKTSSHITISPYIISSIIPWHSNLSILYEQSDAHPNQKPWTWFFQCSIPQMSDTESVGVGLISAITNHKQNPESENQTHFNHLKFSQKGLSYIWSSDKLKWQKKRMFLFFPSS